MRHARRILCMPVRSLWLKWHLLTPRLLCTTPDICRAAPRQIQVERPTLRTCMGRWRPERALYHGGRDGLRPLWACQSRNVVREWLNNQLRRRSLAWDEWCKKCVAYVRWWKPRRPKPNACKMKLRVALPHWQWRLMQAPHARVKNREPCKASG